MNKYEVWAHSEPGMWTFYEGALEVTAKNDEDAAEIAQIKLAKMYDRPAKSWIVDKVIRRLK